MRVLRRDPEGTDTIETTEETTDTEPVTRTEPVTETTTTPTVTSSEIEAERWSVADAVVAVVGAGLALVGAIALVRTGVDKSWFRPVVNVLDARHTPLLGAIELGAGVLIMLSAPLRSRAPSALLGLGGAILAALAAIQNSDVQRELAIEERWAWMLAAVGVFVAVASLVPPRRRRVERLVHS
jgi:hypothetical protein